MFHVERGVLCQHEPPESDDLLLLCWPVLVYRVIAPVLRVHHLDIFEKVVLALCRAGIRQPDEIARKIHQNADLCQYVMRQLKATKRLDANGVPTPTGLATLSTGRVDEEPEVIVTYLFRDPFTGELWPRTATELNYQPVQRIRGVEADLRLASAGHPRRANAYVVPASAVPLTTPTADQIIGAIAGHRVAEMQRRADQFAEKGELLPGYDAEQELQALNSELTLPTGDDVRRVVDISEPVGEYLLTWIELSTPASEGITGWRACDPFGLNPDLMLHQLIITRSREDARLAAVVSGLTAVADDQHRESYQKNVGEVRQAAEIHLVRLLGEEIRRFPAMLDLLIELKDAVARGAVGAAIETAAREAFRCYEELFRRMVRDYPPPVPSWAGRRANRIVQEILESYASELGFTSLSSFFLNNVKDLRRTLSPHPERPHRTVEENLEAELRLLTSRGYVHKLALYALIAAADPDSADRLSHPLRTLAGIRPSVLEELPELNKLRNRGSHAERDASDVRDVAWCQGLALDAARTMLTMPPKIVERTTTS